MSRTALQTIDRARMYVDGEGTAEELADFDAARAAVAELVAASAELLRCERSQGISDEEYDNAVQRLDAASGKFA